ncbi:hypothetical protein ACRE8B_25510, partial [Klebsiella pneumoniae]
KRAYCLKIQPATGSFARNLIYSTKPENRCNVTVWLGCEQLAGIFGNYWLFIVFQRYKSGKKKTDPGGSVLRFTARLGLFVGRLVDTDRAA